MLILGIAIYHQAIIQLQPSLEDLPDNLRAGFYIIFKFDYLRIDSLSVMVGCQTALAKCNVSPEQCSNLPDPSPITRTSKTMNEKAAIVSNFENSLNTVQKICSDKYLGLEALQKTATDLQKMMDDVKAINSNEAPCLGTNLLYCSIHKSAVSVLDSVNTVTAEIDKLIDSEMVKSWKDNSSMLALLHIVPYILVVSALFFFGLWWRDGTCCFCEGGSKLGCCYIVFHGLFWLLFFVINSIIVGIGAGMKFGSGDITVPAVKGKPKLDVFMEHIQTTYPGFWAKVFADMEEGLNNMFQAALCFEVFCLVIVAYGCCMCCCCPYRKGDERKVFVDEDERNNSKEEVDESLPVGG